LLGVIRGHSDVMRRDSAVDYGQDELEQVNMGIAIVTPARDILDTFDKEDLVQGRRRAAREGPTSSSR
jgi:hypothetical protein